MRIKNLLPKNKSFILSISYGNYVIGSGGTDKVILAHRKMFEDNGISHIHIFECKKRIEKLNLSIFDYWQVVIDGSIIERFFSLSSLIQMLNEVLKSGKILKEIHLHHLLRTSLNQIEVLLESFRVPIKFYLHDYYTICCEYNLLKNGSDFCGGMAVSSEKCYGCCYYEQSQKHYDQIKEFLRQFENRITFICPSYYMRDIWLTAYPQYSQKAKVVLHQTLIGKYKGNCQEIAPNIPLKVAFVGAPIVSKGWRQWLFAVEKAYKKQCNIRFFHFGKSDSTFSHIINVSVCFNKENLNAMITALREYKIDCTVLWSIWPETYSYTYHECTAANTFIITNTLSGNIAAMVQKRNNGIVLNNEMELSELLCDEKRLRFLVNNFKKSKNYGPLFLEENKEIVNLLCNCKGKLKYIADCPKENIFVGVIRTMVYYLYKIYQKWRG